MAMAASTLISFSLLVLAMAIAVNAIIPQEEMTHIHLFFHEVEPNAVKPTTALVSSLHSSSSNFGDIRVFDNYLREGTDPSSKLIGYAQGINVNTSISGMSILTAMNFVFTDGEHKGSSLAIYGGSDTRMTFDEHTVVGGSGKFRMVRGYTLSKIAGFTTSSVAVEADIYLAVDHHEH